MCILGGWGQSGGWFSLSRYLHVLQSTGLLFSELSDGLLFRSREDQVDVYVTTVFNF